MLISKPWLSTETAFLQFEIPEHPPAAADPLRAPQPLSISVVISETLESTLDC